LLAPSFVITDRAWGYAEFLEAIADPNHERHAELTEWSGGDFDPNDLAIEDINAALAGLVKRKRTRSKKPSPTSGNGLH
jgi:hypothetical protein